MDYKYDLEILVDKITREAIFANYLKYRLEKDGFNVKIEHQDFYTKPDKYDFFTRTKEKSKFVLTPSFNVKRTSNLIAKCIRQNSKLLINHSEQLYPDIFNTEKMSLEHVEVYNEFVYGHLVWGEYYKRKLIKYANVNEDTIYKVGNYKFEIIANEQKNTDVKKKYDLIFISNFNVADFNDNQWIEFKKKHGVKTEYKINTHYKKIRANFINFIKKVSEEFPQKKIRVRPHPGEDFKPYKEELCAPNITIGNDCEFVDDIKMSKMAILHSSSSVFELIRYGIPQISLDVGKLPKHLAQPPQEIFNYYNEDQTLEIIKSEVNINNNYSKEKLLNHVMGENSQNSLEQNYFTLKNILENYSFDDNVKYSFRVYWFYYAYLIEAISKNIILSIGYYLNKLGIKNIIYSFAVNHLKNRVLKLNYVPRRYTLKNKSLLRRVKKMYEFRKRYS